MAWLDQITTSLAARTNVDVEALTLDATTRRALLDVAAVAAHTSGERTNAPLLCYVLGVLTERGVALTDAIAVIKDVADEQA